MKYQELISEPKRKVKEKICPACGEKFLSVDSHGVISSRIYCTRLECEKKREKEERKRIWERRQQRRK